MTPHVKIFAEKHLKNFSKNHTILNVGSKIARGQRDITPEIEALNIDMEGGDNVNLVLDANKIIETFGHNAFDSVCSFEALEHCNDWKGMIREMWFTLKPGGLFVLTMAAFENGYHGYPHDYVRMELDDLKRIFEGHPIVDTLNHNISIGVVIQKKEYPFDGLKINLDTIKIKIPTPNGVRTK